MNRSVGLTVLILGLGASLACGSSSGSPGNGMGGGDSTGGRGGDGGSNAGTGGGGAGTTGRGGTTGSAGASGTAGAAGGAGTTGSAGASGSGAGAGTSGAAGTTGNGGRGGGGGTAGTGGGAGMAGSGGRGGTGGAAGTSGGAGTIGNGGRGGSGGTAGASGGGGAAGATCPVNPPAGLPSGPLTRYSGNPLLRNGPEAVDFQKTGPRVVVKEGSTNYRMWYEAVGANGLTTVALATSTDGLTWTKQGTVLSSGGSTSWERDEVSPNFMLVEGGVYKLWYHGGGYFMGGQGTRYGAARVGYATSPDGMTWTKYAGNPVLDIGPSGAFDDEQVAEPRITKIGTTYRMYYTGRSASSKRQSLGMASSTDGISWTKDSRNPILDSTRWGSNWGGAFFYESGLWLLWHGDDAGGSHLNFKWSRDGIAWTDGTQNPVLRPSTIPNAPDSGLVGDSVSGYRDGNTYRIMYTGYADNLFGTDGRFEGICMASVMATCP